MLRANDDVYLRLEKLMNQLYALPPTRIYAGVLLMLNYFCGGVRLSCHTNSGKMLPPGFVKVLRPEICALKPCNKHVTAQLVSRSEYPSW